MLRYVSMSETILTQDVDDNTRRLVSELIGSDDRILASILLTDLINGQSSLLVRSLDVQISARHDVHAISVPGDGG